MGDVGQAGEQSPPEENGQPFLDQEVPVVELNGEHAAELQAADEEPAEEERERTLTDHLNRKLLESFLNRLESGDMNFPPGTEGAQDEEEWNDG